MTHRSVPIEVGGALLLRAFIPVAEKECEIERTDIPVIIEVRTGTGILASKLALHIRREAPGDGETLWYRELGHEHIAVLVGQALAVEGIGVEPTADDMSIRVEFADLEISIGAGSVRFEWAALEPNRHEAVAHQARESGDGRTGRGKGREIEGVWYIV